ncbi:hypothetical protein DPX16_1836 [Anabarilius grahami]|uniref:Transposase Tc1-like domain-containing protein n=1 Tax=Anabarilius grahami TaxID=495550 RepID=A0A3N0Z9N9_ANAGA|nr:hypothetical protein DPX16_1836 [Anabarilius grahami]
MGKRKDLSVFDKDQIVTARRLGQSIPKTAALVGCSRSAVVSIYQKCFKEGTVVNRRQGHGRTRLIESRGERRLARVVRSNRRAPVAQIAQEVNAGSDRKVSEYTVHLSLLRMGLDRVPMLTRPPPKEPTVDTAGTRISPGLFSGAQIRKHRAPIDSLGLVLLTASFPAIWRAQPSVCVNNHNTGCVRE